MWPELHLNVTEGQDVGGADGQVEFSTAYNDVGDRIGCALSVHGWRLNLTLGAARAVSAEDAAIGAEPLFRPRELRFARPAGQDYVISLRRASR